MITTAAPPAPTAAPPEPAAWVEAAPFRSHLRHLCTVSGLPWAVVALQAGLSIRHADALLHGRRGRPLRRLPRPTATRLWALTVDDLAALGRVAVPAEPVAHRVEALLLEGVPLRRVCRQLGWSPGRVAALLDAELAGVSASEALRVRALAETWDRDRLADALRAA